MKTFLNMLRDDSGASAAEYALILAIVGSAIALAAIGLGKSVSSAMTNALRCINHASNTVLANNQIAGRVIAPSDSSGDVNLVGVKMQIIYISGNVELFVKSSSRIGGQLMKRQSLIALGIALLLGLLAVYLANIFLSRNEDKAADAAAGTSRVAVAVVPLDYGMEITPDKIRFANLPNAALPVGTYTQLNDLFPMGQKRVALRRMEVNEPILKTKISGEGQNASIAALLPDGKRAAAVRINDVSGVAGFVQPNDSVDVLITRQEPGGTSQKTDVLLQNTRVLALDQTAKNPDGTPQVAKSATLEVDPLDAQKLALAQQVGTLSLVLRKPGDEQNNPVVETISLDDLRYTYYGGARYANSPGAPAAAGLPRSVRRRASGARSRSRPPTGARRRQEGAGTRSKQQCRGRSRHRRQQI